DRPLVLAQDAQARQQRDEHERAEDHQGWQHGRSLPYIDGMSASAAVRFAELHRSGCFVLPNPWDAGSAVLLERLGFRALATTSAGLAFSRARADGPGGVSRDEFLAHVREVVA